jgi:hypothetical protein
MDLKEPHEIICLLHQDILRLEKASELAANGKISGAALFNEISDFLAFKRIIAEAVSRARNGDAALQSAFAELLDSAREKLKDDD